MAQYSKAAQTETLGEKNYEKADISDEDDEGEQGRKEMDTTDIASTGIFPSAKKSVEVARCPLTSSTSLYYISLSLGFGNIAQGGDPL